MSIKDCINALKYSSVKRAFEKQLISALKFKMLNIIFRVFILFIVAISMVKSDYDMDEVNRQKGGANFHNKTPIFTRNEQHHATEKP